MRLPIIAIVNMPGLRPSTERRLKFKYNYKARQGDGTRRTANEDAGAHEGTNLRNTGGQVYDAANPADEHAELDVPSARGRPVGHI